MPASSAHKSSATAPKISLDDLNDDQIKSLLAEYARNKKAQTAAKKKNKAAAEQAAIEESERQYQREQDSSQAVEGDDKDSSDEDEDDDTLGKNSRKHARRDSEGDSSDSSVENLPKKKKKTAAIEIDVDEPQPLKKQRTSKKKKPVPEEAPLVHAQAATPAGTGPFTPYARKVNPNAANKPRGEDFTPTSKRMIDEGKNHFAVYIATENAFPKDEEAFAKADSIFGAAATAADKDTKAARRGARFMADETYKKDIRNAIKNTMSAFRGRVVDAAEPLVEAAYDMKKKKETKDARAKRVQELVDNGLFAFEDTKEREGFLGHEIIPELFSKTFLYRPSNKKQGLGFGQHAATFKTVPNHLLAFLLTAIECALRHWLSGTYKEEKFDGNVYDEIYDNHLDSIELLESQAPAYMLELKDDIWNSSCELAGIQPTIIVHDGDKEDSLGYISKDDVGKLTRRRNKST